MSNIDYDRLRADLIDDLGPATMYNEMAQADLIYIETCSDEELEDYARKNGINPEDYQKFTR